MITPLDMILHTQPIIIFCNCSAVSYQFPHIQRQAAAEAFIQKNRCQKFGQCIDQSAMIAARAATGEDVNQGPLEYMGGFVKQPCHPSGLTSAFSG